ncbi:MULTISPECIES: thiolase family protein [Xanthobacter]|jgi:acetyl-CoA C-acetyltransferase|uniref:Beta-ketothiolase n=1 Tax=Xanthobacter flavus TaxID=281 RepID=A0A9W6FJD2_XANFL|nr:MULTISPECIES: acetyl-CoA C-acetyltransferase [Xanthobacter]MBN8917093.1 acetyl-CoA C-acetyltransferase [Hyphomicrobiales bacterium]MBP2147451.1 acetyl-CoA C-acetyltransferase [Xanthobacter flavus]MCG5237198.1 acetyl-CoA C-acetyltransferase [Xanthobacter oligotrophicus]MDR6331620.1 acetyl-CoA C-acetyltransferase [Xanthobacter flavus]GLI22589.1 acetyl-CoA acetyltransferase [Xanthobacter flavus]
MTKRDVVICAPVRTAIGTYNGALKAVPATELGATVVRETLRRSGLDAAKLSSLIMGNVVQAGNKMNPARQAAVHGGVPVEVPAMTVNRVCGSGAQAVASVAQEIWLGFADAAIAGGMENMDAAPYLMSGGRWGYRMGDAQIYDSMLRDGLNDAFSGEHSGWHTEDLVTKCGVSREDQDRWAARSQQRFSQAQAAGKFDAEIVGVEIKGRKGPEIFARDEHNRPDTTIESLTKLKPAFRKDGTITAGNAPGLNTGAAAMILAERDFAAANGLEPLARLVAFGVGAVEPGMFGIGPVPAVRQALGRAGWTIAEVERVEINEAFAAIALAVTRELGLAEEVVNVEGGAIAHGHPIGASGAILTTRLIHSMRRDGLKRGIVTLCIGGGQGIALAIETLA